MGAEGTNTIIGKNVEINPGGASAEGGSGGDALTAGTGGDATKAKGFGGSMPSKHDSHAQLIAAIAALKEGQAVDLID